MPDDPTTGDEYGTPSPWQEPDGAPEASSDDTGDVEATAEAEHRIDITRLSEATSTQIEAFSGPADTLTLADTPDPSTVTVTDTVKGRDVAVTVDDNVVRRAAGGYFGKGRNRWQVTYTA